MAWESKRVVSADTTCWYEEVNKKANAKAKQKINEKKLKVHKMN